MLSLQFEDKNVLELGESYHIIAPYLNNLVNIVIFLPFFNNVFLPFLCMSLKLRLVIGLIFNLMHSNSDSCIPPRNCADWLCN